ncbi:MAG: transporter substrate-binding domain-containing protein [Alphaproteobacteria bacterium]|nr:transporter substrate-binding domain-containing protein [Alphaproteobacteria bacterium]
MTFLGSLKATLAALAVALVAVAPASAQTIDDIVKRGKLIVAVDVTTPPYGRMGADGSPEGHEPDMARALAKHMGVPVELVPVTTQNRIPFLISNRVDMVISLFSITPERAKQIWFSIPYSFEASVLVAPKGTEVKTLKDLAGKRVSVPRGTIQDTILTDANIAGINIMRYDDESAAIQAMMSGQAEVVGTGSLVSQQMNQRQPGKDYENKITLRSFHQGVGIRKGQTDLLQWLNTTIYFMKNTGELQALRTKYMNQELGELPVF